MCLISFAYNVHKQYRLILVANRDEFYNRPTEVLHFWKDHPDILGGRDLQAGGTWLAVHRNGRFAALTNVRNPADLKPDAESRGDLITQYLLSDDKPHNTLEKLTGESRKYNGFNLLAGCADDLFFYSTTDQKILTVTDGVHGLSNRTLDTPWPKVKRAKKALKESLLKNREPSEHELLEFMRDQTEAEKRKLPDTGVGLALEIALSPLFISIPGYGTRSTSLITINHNNQINFTEITWDETCKETARKKFTLGT